jgi:hypothetical protein
MSRDEAAKPPNFDVFIALLDPAVDAEGLRVASEELHRWLTESGAPVPSFFHEEPVLRKLLDLFSQHRAKEVIRLVAEAVRAVAAARHETRLALIRLGAVDALGVAFDIDCCWGGPVMCAIPAALGELFRQPTEVPRRDVDMALRMCHDLLQHVEPAVQDATCAAVSLITVSDAGRKRSYALNIFPLVVELLGSGRPSAVQPAIVVCGNYCNCKDLKYTQRVLKAGVLPLVVPMLSNTSDAYKLVRKDICWLLSNVAASEDEAHVQAVIDSGAIPPLVRCLASDARRGVRREAMWALTNAALVVPEQVVALDSGIPAGVCAFLRSVDPADNQDVRATGAALEFCYETLRPPCDPGYRDALVAAGIEKCASDILATFPDTDGLHDFARDVLDFAAGKVGSGTATPEEADGVPDEHPTE